MPASSEAPKGTFSFVSLGCPKNLVDSERMLGLLAQDGYSLVPDSERSDLVIINTCGFIDAARQESLGVIREMLDRKRRGELKGVVVAQSSFVPLLQTNATGLNTIFVKEVPSSQPDAVQTALESALEPYPTARVQSNAQQKEQITSGVNQLLVIVYALLALSVMISLFGIVNTLVLSIFERTREIGMLRAVGTTRRQLRAMIRWEAVLTAIIGGVLGVLRGIMFGWAICRGLESEGFAFVFPTVQIVVFLVLSIVAGVVAAILPARRAARLDVLEALHYE